MTERKSFDARARMIVDGPGDRRRTKYDLIKEVDDALMSAYQEGVKFGRATAGNAPKVGAIAALETTVDQISRTIQKLREDLQ